MEKEKELPKEEEKKEEKKWEVETLTLNKLVEYVPVYNDNRKKPEELQTKFYIKNPSYMERKKIIGVKGDKKILEGVFYFVKKIENLNNFKGEPLTKKDLPEILQADGAGILVTELANVVINLAYGVDVEPLKKSIMTTSEEEHQKET